MTLTSALKHTLREAMLITTVATLLGIAYTFVLGKGFFAPPAVQSAADSLRIAPVPPEFISLEEVLALHKGDLALFIDARHEYDYKLGHIPGAINIPLKDYSLANSPLANIPKQRLLVIYCDGAECNSSIELAKKLSEAGFVRVKMFFGGWTEWQAHHLRVEAKE